MPSFTLRKARRPFHSFGNKPRIGLALVSFCMKHIVVALVLFAAAFALRAQQSPDVDISNATAEFISNPEKPQFAVVGIVVKGEVDTLGVVVHPSAIQSLDGKYRYKPKVVSIRRIDSHLVIVLELSGKGIPLPDDSVRGSARLSVRGAGNLRGSRVRFESKRFDVFVANAPLPNAMIITNDIQVDPIFDNTTGIFHVRGVFVRWSNREAIDNELDRREIVIDSVYAHVLGVEVGEVGGTNRYSSVLGISSAKLLPGAVPEYELAFRVAGGKFPLRKGLVKGSVELELGVVYSHGGITKRRVKRQSIAITN